MKIQQTIKVATVAASLLILAAGCATKAPKKSSHTFFPVPPDEPRIQYLTSFGSESDLGGGSTFADFVVGGDKMHRPIWKPYGITTTKGMVYVVDTQAGSLCEVDLQKKKIRYTRPTGQDALQTPINVAVDADGTRYVTDTKRGQVIAFGKDDEMIEFTRRGGMKPCGIAVSNGRLYVTDMEGHCVRVYDTGTRKEILVMPSDASDVKAKMHSPTNVDVDEAGNVYVSDSGGFTTHIYDAKGKQLRVVGEQGLNVGHFALPKGIAVDRAQRMYVVDAATTVVQMFDDKGRLLMFFGEPKSSGPGGMYLPAGITIDYENVALFEQHVAPGQKIEHLIFVTNQVGPNKVSVYGFLKKG